MKELIRRRLLEFLEEDLGREDVTSRAVIAADRQASARVESRAAGIVAGIEEALLLCELGGLAAEGLKQDGEAIDAKQVVLGTEGSARSILGIERTLLNLLSHMSGIATLTKRAVAAVEGSGVRIAATRKTLPGLRWFEKRAVEIGGADPHRRDLAAAVLIKDNHLVVVGDVAEAVRRARQKASFTQQIEVEVESRHQALAAAEAGADILLLDNLEAAEIGSVVEALEQAGLRERLLLEASGGISIEALPRYAKTGVDVISMGALTASAPFLDYSLEISTA
ncbi:MAG: carboxylating nicotinate-nucleotide diphosphorylase [Acidobacteriota bacterium]